MPLEKRIISIQFAQGLDQKTDPKITGKLTTADNAVLRQTGTIEKRPGFVALGSWSISANPVKVFPFKDSAFVVTDYSTDALIDPASSTADGVPHTTANIGNAWVGQTFYANASCFARQLLAMGGSINNAEVAIVGHSATQSGVAICQFIDSTLLNATGIAQSDLDSESISITTAGYAANSQVKSKVVSTSATSITAAMLGLSGTALLVSFVTNSAYQSITTSSIGAYTTAQLLDAIALNSQIYFTTKNSTSTGLIIGSFDMNSHAISTTTINASMTPTVLAFVAPVANTDRIRLLWSSSTTTLMASFSLTLSQILAPSSPLIASITNVIQLGGCENTGATTWDLFISQQSSATYPNNTAWYGNFTNTAAASFYSGGNGNGMPGCVLAARPFQAQGKSHIVVNWSVTGSQCFVLAEVMRDNGPFLAAKARTHYGLAASPNVTVGEWLPQVVSSDTNTYWFPARKTIYFNSSNGTITTNAGVDLVRFDFSQTAATPYVRSLDNTVLGGGFLMEHDGLGTMENGFLTPPAILTVNVTTSGGSVGTGTYSVLAYKEFTDLSGRTHRSAPSLPTTITSTTNTSKLSAIYYDGPTQRFSSPRYLQTRICFFRTQANGSIYYRDTSTQFSQANTLLPSGGITVAQTLTVSDATLSGGDIIYTQGGSLPNWTPDGVVAVCEHQSRLFCNDSSDPAITRFSKEFVPGEGIAFAQSNIIKHPAVGGRVTAYGSLDSTLVGFKSRMIFAVVGNGPDDTGLNGTFSDGQILFHDVGAINQRNVCRMSAGIVFKSPDKGFYLLTRDLQLNFIGADVQNYNSKTVVSSEVVALAEANGPAEECRFLCSDGTLLIWNYTSGQWTTASLPGCVDAVQTGGKYVVVNTSTTATNARVFQQSMSTYTDDYASPGSVTYQMSVETGWIKTNDMSGFQRIWDVMLLGTSQGPGKITVEIGYDYEAAYNEVHTATMSSLTSANYTGAAESAPEMHVSPTRQKCQAIRFRVKDIPDPGNTTGVFKLTDISLECGVKSGRFRLPASKDG